MIILEMDLSEEKGNQTTVEGFIELPDREVLIDDPDRITQYRAVALAEGLQKGTEAQVLWAWQWLSDHPEVHQPPARMVCAACGGTKVDGPDQLNLEIGRWLSCNCSPFAARDIIAGDERGER